MALYGSYVRQCRSINRTPYVHPEHPAAEDIWDKTNVRGEERDHSDSALYEMYVDQAKKSGYVPFACAHLVHKVFILI